MKHIIGRYLGYPVLIRLQLLLQSVLVVNYASMRGTSSAEADDVTCDLIQHIGGLDSDKLKHLFNLLSVEDLIALASFPTQPHRLLHVLLSIVHCLFLRVKTSSSDIPFEVLPWTKVRVDLLSEPSNFLHRLKKHLRSIRKGKKRLTRTQLRFISECFEEQPPSRVTLEEYNRISTIAACLASWIYLCVYYCYFDSHVPRDQQYLEATQEKILIQAEEEKPINSSFIGHYRQMRFSIKHKGQFYLFRVRCDPLQLRIGYLRLDSRCIESSMDTKQSLKPLDSSHLLLPTGIEPIDVFQLPTISFKSIVLQMIHYSTLLELSRKKLLNGQKSLSPSEDAKRQFPLLLKYIAINKSKVVGIGSATVNGKITLKEFRPIITDHLKSVMNSEEETFAFILQGAIISIYLERNYRLPALLPVALLYIHSIDKRSKPKSDLKIASQIPNLLSFHCRIACGVNTMIPNHIPTALEETPQMTVSMYLLGDSDTVASNESEMCNKITELFLNWSAVLSFQAMGHATSILKKKKVKRKLDSPPPPSPYQDQHVVSDIKRKPRRKNYKEERDLLVPMYAIGSLEEDSPSVVILKTPFKEQVLQVLNECFDQVMKNEEGIVPVRLLAGTTEELIIELHAIGFSHDQHTKSTITLQLEVDETNSLPTFQDAYLWRIIDRNAQPTRISSFIQNYATDAIVSMEDAASRDRPKWLQDVLFFVRHPILDFDCSPFSFQYFNIKVSYAVIEKIVEDSFWSRGIVWNDLVLSTSFEDLFRLKYEIMCKWHPPASFIDSVKFGRFIRDSQIKPSQIGIGDIAYIFARNCAIGSKYEMQFDGFIRAIQMVATMMYPSIPEQKRLPNLFLSVMIYSTNIRPLWKQIVESWRMKIKISLLGSCSLRYCAVTRIQAKYRSLCTYRKYQQTLLMRRIRRHASIKIQSIVRMHRQRSYFLYLKSIVIRIQVFIKARHILRTLKRQRYEYIEACRLKLQRWSKYRLRILRQWKMLNARWIARRERIRKKRARKICVRVYEIEDTRFRFSLFKAIDPETEKLTDDFELDIVQPFSSQYFSTIIPNSYVKIWLQEEHHINPMGLDLSEKTESELIDLGKLSANQILGIIVSRIRWKRKFQGKNLLFSFYRSPFGTSLGKLHFHGTIRATQFCILLPQCFKYLDDEGKIQAQNQQTKEYPSIYVVVRLFQTMNYFTLLSYCPTNGERKMWQFSGLFFYSILQVFPSFTTFPLPPFISMDEALSFKHQQYAFNYVKDALNKSKRMETMRKLLSYLYAFGIKLPSHKMLPIVIENKERARQAIEEEKKRLLLEKKKVMAIRIQTLVRQVLAVKRCHIQAKLCFTKIFSRSRQQFVYINTMNGFMCPSKPRLLFGFDIQNPPNEWQSIHSKTTGQSVGYLNPATGQMSRFNHKEAAKLIQQWYRSQSFSDFKMKDLKTLVKAIRFHQDVHQPVIMNDEHFESAKKYAFHLHVMKFDFIGALGAYEAALEIRPQDVPLRVGYAILLAYSCRYPKTKTWKKSLQLLASARKLDPFLETVTELDSLCFRWSVFVHPKNAHAMGNYALFLQFVHQSFDNADKMYRRAIAMDSSNDLVIENYMRMQQELGPHGLYAFAGPSREAIRRSTMVKDIGGGWKEMEDSDAHAPDAHCFYYNVEKKQKQWGYPE